MTWWATIQSFLSAFNGVISVIRDFFSWKKSSDDRQAGADAAAVEGQRKEDVALSNTQTAIDESDKKPIEYRD